MLLIMADISGYTRYMTANAKTLAHSQTIITELIMAIINQIELPLVVAKLEGDAVFLYCRKQDGSQSWPEAKLMIGKNLLTLFQMFSQKLKELGANTTCSCNACTHIESLGLKIIVHSGEALFHRVFNFVELAGVDVIIIHRLLKNSVNASQYILLTEAAREDLEFPGQIQLSPGTESYEDIGQIKTLHYLPGGASAAAPQTVAAGFAAQFAASWKLMCKLWFAPFASRAGKFRNVEAVSGSAARASFAVLTLLLTPVYLPVGTVLALIHALRKPAGSAHPGDAHIHKADGSCCGRH